MLMFSAIWQQNNRNEVSMNKKYSKNFTLSLRCSSCYLSSTQNIHDYSAGHTHTYISNFDCISCVTIVLFMVKDFKRCYN